MLKAYTETIEDLEIKLRATEFWRFKARKDIKKEIEKYTELVRTIVSNEKHINTTDSWDDILKKAWDGAPKSWDEGDIINWIKQHYNPPTLRSK